MGGCDNDDTACTASRQRSFPRSHVNSTSMAPWNVGSNILHWTLRVEGDLNGESAVTGSPFPPACSSTVRWLSVAVVGSLFISYYALQLLIVYDNQSSMIKRGLGFSMFLDMVTSLSLYLTLWSAPLTKVLGLDQNAAGIPGQKGDRTCSVLSHRLSEVMKDSTLVRIGIGSFVAFVVLFAGDLAFFIPMTKLPWSLVFLYVSGAVVTNAGVGVGCGYVALVHNVLGAQLQTLAERIEHEIEKPHSFEESQLPHDAGGTGYGSVEDGSDDESRELLGRHGGIGLAPPTTLLTVDTLVRAHIEFRRRQDTLAASFHLWVALALITFLTNLVLIVTKGYTEHHEEFSILQNAGLLVIFFANAYSLWIIVFTMGRVAFVSKEECGFAACQWALLTQHKDDERKRAADAAAMMSRYPVVFHVGPVEMSEEIVKAISFLLLGLAGAFIEVHVPEL